jgi:hypothetical protein
MHVGPGDDGQAASGNPPSAPPTSRGAAEAPPIPVIDARQGGPVAIARAGAERMTEILRLARRNWTPPALAITDRISHAWLKATANPYLGEIDAIAALAGARGAHVLNISYEWCCTSGVGVDPDGGNRLLRVLDWNQPGLGRNVVIARQAGPAGDFLNLTWPGYVGVLTAVAPGRFAAAINQPPMMSWGRTPPIDWIIGRHRVWHSCARPPAHLLRRVFETCATYADAKAMLTNTPLCLPAFFTLAGATPGEGCVIERTPDRAGVRVMPAAVANHWISLKERGRPRGQQSEERLATMDTALAGRGDWKTAPIINIDTRLLAIMNPTRGTLTAQGWERKGPVTAWTEATSVS